MSSLKLVTPGIAIVTGASSGIGRACAISLAAAGWTVVISGRRDQELIETDRLSQEKSHGKAKPMTAVAGDLANPDAVENLFQVVKKKFGRLDLLFNNAGIAVGGKMEDVPLADFKKLVDINITAPFLCTQQAFKIMRDQTPQGGRIINNGSISAYTPRPYSAPYTLSKHAILGLTKSTALDGRAYNIACTQLDIGNAESALSAGTSPEKLQASGHMLEEATMPAEYVAYTLVHIASLPLDVNILTQNIMATKMPFVGRG